MTACHHRGENLAVIMISISRQRDDLMPSSNIDAMYYYLNILWTGVIAVLLLVVSAGSRTVIAGVFTSDP